ncbi:HK97 family phage portal protein [Lutibacter sp. Hel_I_33_5]|uniref:phage portal protein n=1 Tax=Lutibacter sp. Hel_I_33_5 TaxID=1566289 RepID=UPI00119ED758|nr:phage portal protein [Lutibacter sp. Hel_I_33_5]TVZ55607.1 HK97 family phage portal protein [Lutibacter sp. Hel_I_33_5]
MIVDALQQNYLQTRSAQPVSSGGFLGNFFGGGAVTKNGTVVNNNSALTLSAFYNGITILSNDYAKLPKSVIVKADNNRTPDSKHVVNNLIGTRPNQYMSAFNYDSIMMQCAILKGNAYSEIVRNKFTGKIESRQFINENKTPVTVKEFEEKLFYHFNNRVVPAENMEHIIGFSDNGITGIGVVAYAAKSLSVPLKSQEFAEEYYRSKGIGVGVITNAVPIKDDAKIRYAKAVSDQLSSANPFKVAVLDQAGSFQHVKLTPQESMFLETNKHAIEEVARWLNIPSHKLKSTENSNYSNMESQNIDHTSNSVLPWSIKFRQEQNEKLFTAKEKANGYRIHHNSNSLLEADKKTQAMWFSTLVYSGAMTRNEVRNLLDMNSLAGLDEPLTPVNMETMAQIQKKLKEVENE